MKKSYITWNRSQVPDEVIIGDMTLLSKGRLKMTEGVKILEIRELLPQTKKKPQGKPMGNLMASSRISHSIKSNFITGINGYFYRSGREAAEGRNNSPGRKE